MMEILNPQTFVIPGFSIRNKVWAEEVKANLSPKIIVAIVEWPHWKTGKTETDWIESETRKLLELIQDTPINIIAK